MARIRVRESRRAPRPRASTIGLRQKEAEEPPYDNMLANVRPDGVYQAIARSILEKSLQHAEELRQKIMAKSDVAEPIAGDTYYIMYSYMPLLKKPEQIQNEILRELRNVFEEFMGSNEYRAVRSITRLNREASMVYAMRFAKTFLAELAKRLPPEEWPSNPPPAGMPRQGGGGEQAQGQSQCPGGGQCKKREQKQGQTGGGQNQHKQDKGGRSSSQAAKREMDKEAIKKAVREAAEKAREEAKEAVEAYSALGGLSQGFTPAKLAFLDEEPGIDEVEFKTIIEILGSLRRAMPLMFTQYKKPDRMGFPEGYTITRKPERAIPRELAMPDDIFTMKLVSGKFTAREKKVREKGVMIVLLDRSGSMGGQKMAWAKAVAYALAVKAKREKMNWVTIPFDARPHEPITLDNAEQLLRVSAWGGTNIANAMIRGLLYAEEHGYKRANIIVITDGIDNSIVNRENEILAKAKKLNASIKVVYIRGDNEVLRRIASKTRGQLLSVEPNDKNAIRVVSAA